MIGVCWNIKNVFCVYICFNLVVFIGWSFVMGIYFNKISRIILVGNGLEFF